MASTNDAVEAESTPLIASDAPAASAYGAAEHNGSLPVGLKRGLSARQVQMIAICAFECLTKRLLTSNYSRNYWHWVVPWHWTIISDWRACFNCYMLHSRGRCRLCHAHITWGARYAIPCRRCVPSIFRTSTKAVKVASMRMLPAS